MNKIKDGLFKVVEVLYRDGISKKDATNKIGMVSYFQFIENFDYTKANIVMNFDNNEEPLPVFEVKEENGYYWVTTANSTYILADINDNRIYCENCSDVIEENEYIVYHPTNAKYHNEDCLMDDLKHFLILKEVPIKFFSQTHCESNQCNQKLKKEALSYIDGYDEEYLFCSEACFIHYLFENDIIERIERK